MLNGLGGLDTLIGGAGDDTYIIRNYERGQNSILLYNEAGNYVASFLPTDDQMQFTFLDHTGDGKVDFLRVFYSSDDHFWNFDFTTNKLG